MPAVFPQPNCYFTIYPELDEDVFVPEVDWREEMDTVSPFDAHFSSDGASHAVLNGVIPYNKLRSFIFYSLGYAQAENRHPWRLFRVNPPTHPLYPWLRVRSVSVRGFKPRKDPHATMPPSPPPPPPPPAQPWLPYPAGTNLPGSPDLTRIEEFHENGKTWQHPTASLAARMYGLRPRRSGESFGKTTPAVDDRPFIPFAWKTTRYEEAKVSVEFGQPNWPILEDSDPAHNPLDESTRNVFWTTEPALDVLTIEGGQGNGLFWRETTSNGPAVANNIPAASSTAVTPALSGFKSPMGFLDAKMTDVANWMHVPQRFIFDNNLVPDKILRCLGKVNSTEWYGYRPGTALLMSVSFQPMAWPIHSVDRAVVQLWNVRYQFKYYDPERPEELDPPITVTPTPGADAKRGWRLFRFQNGFVYHATRYNGNELYGEAEFRQLFQHREMP